jgi:hypothetical protein
VESTKHSSLIVLSGPRRLSCGFPYSYTEIRDSLQTIDHSSGDVAYLRLTGHSEGKTLLTESRVPHRTIFDSEFQHIFDSIKDTPEYRSIGSSDGPNTLYSDNSQLIKIGRGVYATDTITTSSTSSIETDIHYCLDKLLCTSS